MTLRIRHVTRYAYDAPAPFGLQRLRKTPKSHRHQRVLAWRTEVQGGRKELSFEDHHRNTVELVSFEPDTTEVTLISEGEVAIADNHGVVGPHEGFAPLWLFLRPTARTRPGKALREIARAVAPAPPLERLHALSAATHDAVRYERGGSHPDWSAEDAAQAGRGVCQDHAHLFIAIARAWRIPARYVSGYLMMDGVQTQEAMHAWAEAHVDGLGWVGFDVSNGISPDARYVRVATGLDYDDAAPVSGSRIGGGAETLSVALEVAQQ